MLLLVIVLGLTNLATAAALLYLRVRPAIEEAPADDAVRAALDALERTGAPSARPRQFISVELLNPIEVAGTRGRVLGLAGSLAPGFTRRVVYDQTVKELRRQLAAQGVVADVHVHSLRPVRDAPAGPPAAAQPRTLVVEPVNYVDDIDRPLDDEPGAQPPVQ